MAFPDWKPTVVDGGLAMRVELPMDGAGFVSTETASQAHNGFVGSKHSIEAESHSIKAESAARHLLGRGNVMRRYLVVGHRTLGGAHLMDHLHALREADPYCRFELLVPVYKPRNQTWTDNGVRIQAQRRLEEILDRMASMGMGAVGVVGDANPVNAIGDVLRKEGTGAFTGIVLSTLPEIISSWWDVPHRITRNFPDIPLTHLVADETLLSTEATAG